MTAVASFYRFVDLDDLETLRARVETTAALLDLRGTVLIAHEGINGALAGSRAALEDFLASLRSELPFVALDARVTDAASDPFARLKVRIRTEVVAFGRPDARPVERTGERVGAERWNALLADPDVLVIDARNRYETAIGTFEGALDPGTGNFREFASWMERCLDPAATPRVAMFCTGGIRCEKASAWLLARGFGEVFQLEGGILGYLDSVSAEANRWHGECFVFDQRVALDAALAQGDHEQCHACRRPLGAAERASALYEPGVSCPHCHSERAESERVRLRERRRQIELAAARGARHLAAQHEVRLPPYLTDSLLRPPIPAK
jgi:UPF0176 protein